LKKGDDFFDNCFFNNKVYVWLAPADGLFLDRINFTGYNKKIDVDIKLDLDQNKEDTIKLFRQNIVYPEIVNREITLKRYLILYFILDLQHGKKLYLIVNTTQKNSNDSYFYFIYITIYHSLIFILINSHYKILK